MLLILLMNTLSVQATRHLPAPVAFSWEQLRITSLPGYSDFEKKDVPVYYGERGPGRLYQRAGMLRKAEPRPTPLHEDDGALDFWNGLRRG